jgi:hypothetical protein
MMHVLHFSYIGIFRCAVAAYFCSNHNVGRHKKAKFNGQLGTYLIDIEFSAIAKVD